MKKSLVASGFMGAVASLLGVVAVGCSAETGDPGAQIGSTAEALTSTQARKFTASCTIKDSVSPFTEHTLYAGGIDGNGVVKDEIFESTDGSTFTALGTKLHVARFNLSAIVPDSSKQICVFVGGDENASTSAASTEVDYVTVASGSFTVTTGADLAVARILPELSTCGSQIIAVGGFASNGDGINSLDVSDDFTPGSWATSGTNMGAKRGKFSLVKDGSNDRYVIAGGKNNGGNVSKIETMEMATVNGTTCTPTFTDLVNANTPIGLSHAVEGLVGVRSAVSGSTSTFKFLAGRQSTSTLNDKEDTIVVDWSDILGSSTASAANLTFSYHPLLAFNSSGVPYVIGGSNANESAPSLLVKHLASGSFTADTALSVGHYRGAAAPLGTAIKVNTGDDIGTGLATTTETY